MSQPDQIPMNQSATDGGVYKSQLQNLCMRRSWPLPEYKTLQEGPYHIPHFKASVIVNGITFETSELFKRAKEAQIEAAKIALAHYSSSAQPSGGIGGTTTLGTNGNKRPMTDEMRSIKLEEHDEKMIETKRNKHSGVELHVYKNQLQSVAMKKGYDLPIYAFVREGPPHNSRFKAKVTINGQAYESPEFFGTLKESEHAAAKVALLSLAPTESQDIVSDKSFFKNLLQEFTQKSGLKIPVYNTTSSGASHTPTFTSSVVVDGETFYGQEAKTKKLAEMNAAEVALAFLSQREAQVQCPSGSTSTPSGVLKDAAVSNLQPLNASNLGAATQPGEPSNVISGQSDIELPTIGDQNSPKEIRSSAEVSSNNSSVDVTTNISTLQHTNPIEPLEYIPLSQDECSSQQAPPEVMQGTVPISIPDIFSDTTSLRNVVRVYPRVLNMDLPPGAVVQHIDDKWISIRIPANKTD